MNSSSQEKRPLAPRLTPFLAPDPGRATSGIQRLTKACDSCHSKRKRCDGGKPCSSCRQLQTKCIYSRGDGRMKEHWKARIEALERRNEYLEQTIEKLRRNRRDGVDGIDGYSSQAPSPSEQNHFSGIESRPKDATPQNMREDHDVMYLFYTATASHPLLGPLERGTGFFGGNRRDKLPEEQFSRRALDAFFQCAATLFYVTTPENTEKLLQRVYHSDHASIPDICELSALASIGSHYKKDLIPDEAKAAYLYLASTGLHEAIGADHIQGMRIFICLSMSCIMDKSSSARLLIMPGLNLARAKMETDLRKVTSNQSDEDECRRTLQTLLFLEGWLSYSLGYQNCLKQSEIDLVHYTIPLDTTSINSAGLRTRLIQLQMTKLALLASQIQAKIPPLRDGSWSKADELSADLDKWYYSLPPDLQLATLTKQEEAVTSRQRYGIYLMHMLHVDMRLQLFCRLIKGFAAHREEQDLSSLETFYHQIPRQTLDDHKDFSIQLARIASLLYEEEAILARCWLVIRSVFDACVVLLLGVCLYYLEGRETNAVADMLRNLDLCLTVLEFCSRDDIAAMRLRNMLDPVVREFRLTRQASRVQQGHGHSMGVEYLLNDRPPEKPDLVRLTHRLLNFMTPARDVWV